MEFSDYNRWVAQLSGIICEMPDDEWDEIDDYQFMKWRESGYLEWLLSL